MNEWELHTPHCVHSHGALREFIYMACVFEKVYLITLGMNLQQSSLLYEYGVCVVSVRFALLLWFPLNK